MPQPDQSEREALLRAAALARAIFDARSTAKPMEDQEFLSRCRAEAKAIMHWLGNVTLPIPPLPADARLIALCQLAEAATPGPWVCTEVLRPLRIGDAWDDSGWTTEFVGFELLAEDAQVHAPDEGFRREEDALFAAAFDPTTALALLAALTQAQARNAELEGALDDSQEEACLSALPPEPAPARDGVVIAGITLTNSGFGDAAGPRWLHVRINTVDGRETEVIRDYYAEGGISHHVTAVGIKAALSALEDR